MAKRNIPVVPSIRFYTNARRILKNPLNFHNENFEKHGDIFRLKIGFGKSVIFSRNPGLLQYVLQKNQKNYHKSDIQTEEMAKYLGKGLLTSEGEHWKKQRRMIQPAFHKKQLVQLLDTVQVAILTELDKIKTGEPFDIFPVFNDLAFQTVVKSLFSSAVGQEEIDRLQYVTEAAQKMLVKELRQPYLNWWFHLSGSLKNTLELSAEAREILRRNVEKRKNSNSATGDLLDMLLDARYEDGSAMTEEQLIDEILVLFTAGHETTSNALTFTTQLLAKHRDVQERVFQEMKTAKEKTGSVIEFISACTYTKQVIEESMRLYPPVYFIDRVNFEDDEFEDLIIPKGSNLLFSLKEIHTHKEHWEDPDDFRPERFSEDKWRQYSGFYFPFGAGPRMCIGNNFAMYEMILAIAKLVERYEFIPISQEIQIKPLITLKPDNAVLLFTKR